MTAQGTATVLLGASVAAGFLVALAVPATTRLVLAGDPGMSLAVGGAFLAAALLALHAAPAPSTRWASAWAAVAVAGLASLLLGQVQVAVAYMHILGWTQAGLALAGAVVARTRPQANPPAPS